MVLLLATVVQVGIVVSDQVRLWHAAREAARVAAVDADPAHIRSAAEAGGLGSLFLVTSPEERYRVQGEPVTVSVRYSGGRRIPLVAALVGAGPLSASATMRIETP